MELNAVQVVMRSEIEAIGRSPTPEQLAASSRALESASAQLFQVANAAGYPDVLGVREADTNEHLQRLTQGFNTPLAAHILGTVAKIAQASQSVKALPAPDDVRYSLNGAFLGIELAGILLEAGAAEGAWALMKAAYKAALHHIGYYEDKLGQPLFARPPAAEALMLLAEMGRKFPNLVDAGDAAMEARTQAQPKRRKRA